MLPYPMEEMWFLGLMALFLVGLIVLLLYLRNKPQGDDD